MSVSTDLDPWRSNIPQLPSHLQLALAYSRFWKNHCVSSHSAQDLQKIITTTLLLRKINRTTCQLKSNTWEMKAGSSDHFRFKFKSPNTCNWNPNTGNWNPNTIQAYLKVKHLEQIQKNSLCYQLLPTVQFFGISSSSGHFSQSMGYIPPPAFFRSTIGTEVLNCYT